MSTDQEHLQEELSKRFKQLPAVVQDAILSADVEKHMRDLADTHKLHIDQWQKLENEVMLILLGFDQKENLIPNLLKEVGVDIQTAYTLAGKISEVVFEPIRKELERHLDHPAAIEKTLTDAEQARETILASTKEPVSIQAPPTSSVPIIIPAMPPPPPAATKVERSSISETYQPNVPSHERKEVEGDPYREMPV